MMIDERVIYLDDESEGYDMRNVMRLTETCGRTCDGEVEIIIKDRHGRELQHDRYRNIVKICAKEILAHVLPYNKIWDPNAGTGTGAWVSSGLDASDYFPKYILFGASFDPTTGAALDTQDPRYYTTDPVTGLTIPITLGVGAEYDGGLINAIPIADPWRPLKKVERIYFEPTYQPAGTPLMQDDVRAMNNIVVFETTLTKDEYNGFAQTDSDYFTITEVALAGGKEITTTGTGYCANTETPWGDDPKTIFLEGRDDHTAVTINTTGTATVTIDPSDAAYIDLFNEGDQIKIVVLDGNGCSSLPQVNDHYLICTKAIGGSDVTLDRTPVGLDGVTPLTGQVGMFRDSLRIFSHRILKRPFKKSSDFMIIVRWSIILS
jgi:hypothetical protein